MSPLGNLSLSMIYLSIQLHNGTATASEYEREREIAKETCE